MGTRRAGAGRPRTKPPGNESRRTDIRMPAEVEAALDRYIEAQDIPPTRSAVIVHALQQFLAKRARG